MVTAAPFRLLVITPEDLHPQEIHWVSRLFERGLDTLHLRKPGWGVGRLINYLHQLDSCWHQKIMVHYQAAVLEHVEVKGVHFQPHTLPLQRPAYRVSCPVHGWQEFAALEARVDYALISTFFNSISKKGLAANPALLAVPANVQRQKAIALGGIDSSTIAIARNLDLGGAAVLGAIWKATNPLAAFLNIEETLSNA